jgi:hypothetical protein
VGTTEMAGIRVTSGVVDVGELKQQAAVIGDE